MPPPQKPRVQRELGAFAPYVGELTVSEFLLEWVPLILACFLPLLCLPFVALGVLYSQQGDSGCRMFVWSRIQATQGKGLSL